ncbi:carboxypeptidase regulatory-like domain-containing protein [Pyxidicoccus sp. MSG2]|uniref:carboxypeptidase regulatory-like domain-containing protein n=1 Tax=Pyxidicoccus sp. MSG2 TaxID=2996790 RepID=UPI002272154F|nr:carboxypeptidase regulatory-like domain-containing protein [Pyxidicoccus sp. MSG2]MCY1023270.1 carboxypeptidase regulatory-like domain-containing protein [Pyxidicoccus sp. MSG2]
MNLYPLRPWTCALLALCACASATRSPQAPQTSQAPQASAPARPLREQCRTNLDACWELDEFHPTSPAEEQAGCERGDATDCFFLGLHFVHGDGEAEDKARGFQLLGQSCQKQHFAACEHLMSLRYAGMGGEQELSAARPMLEKDCSGDQPMGCLLLGELHWQAEGEARDVTRARAFYERACERGVAKGCSKLGSSLIKRGDDGEEVGEEVSEADLTRALKLFERGCAGGDGEGCASLGSMTMISPDPRAACEAFKKGCEADSPSSIACEGYGGFCDEDFGSDYVMLKGQEKGCRDGSGQDCEWAGEAHEMGEGTRKAPERAARRYARGCELGSFPSCERLANLEALGYPGAAPQSEKARQRLIEACERKLPGACVSLGKALREGKPWLPRDLKAASGYSLRACEQEDAEGCEALALAYQEGLGVEQSGERAFKHHRKACGLGRMESCVKTGASAEALKRREEAVRAYQQSCFRGTASGCEALTRLGEAATLVERSQWVELSSSRPGAETSDLLLLPDSPLLLANARGQLQLIDTRTGKPVGAPVNLSSREVQWKAPHGMSTLIRHAHDLSLSWDARAKEPFGFFNDSGGLMLWRPGLPNPPSPGPAVKERRCLPLASPPSGRRVLLAICSADAYLSPVLQELDVETGKPVGPRVELEAPVTALTVSADGSRYAAGLKDGRVRLIDAETGKVTALPGGDAKEVRSISFHPTRPLLATTSTESDGALLWDTSGSQSAPVRISEQVKQVRFSPDGTLLAAAGAQEGLLLLDASTGQRASPPIPLDGGTSELIIVFSPDGRRLAVTDSGYKVLLVTLRGAAASRSAASVPPWFTRILPLEPPTVPKPPPILMDGRLEGTVRFEGKPVPDAVVELTPSDIEWDDAKALGTKRYPVRPDGTFVLTKVPRIGWWLSVQAPGKKTWTGGFKLREQAHHTGIDVSLERAATLRGRVLSPGKKPAAGVQVSWRGPYSEERSSVVTDARGRFVIDHLHPQTYRLTALAPNGDILSQLVALDKPESREVEWILLKRSDPAVLRVRVVTEGSKPVPGAKLRMELGMQGVTDAQGRWHTDELHGTQYHITPTAEWKGRSYSGKTVSEPFPEEVVITIPDAQF